MLPAKHIIPGWVHEPGRHCGSTALADLCRHRGWPFDEALCFGLGAGLGGFFGVLPEPLPRLFHLRSATLEGDFFRRAGVPFAWVREPDPEHALALLRLHLSGDLPVLLRCDIARLPYFGSRTPMTGHAVVAWGFDDEAREVRLSDTGFRGLQAVGYGAMELAWSSQAFPVPLERDHFAVPPLGPPPDLLRLIPAAIRAQGEALTDDGLFTTGVRAVRAFARDLAGPFVEAENWSFAARFIYQCIERRGTGGGGFRAIYADFLDQAEAALPRLRSLGLVRRMRLLAKGWTEVALALKTASEAPTPAGLSEIAPRVDILADLEEDFAEAARRVE